MNQFLEFVVVSTPFLLFLNSDASRRDLTINAMFLDLEGNVIDYFNGREDLEKKEIRFVGDPSERIREDYLRIFRYFRFYVRYGCHSRHDPATIDAIRDNKMGLKGISGERIWSEMKKILSCQRCDSVMDLIMNDLGISSFMGFQGKQIDMKEFTRAHGALFSETPSPSFEAVTLLSSMILPEEDIKVAQRLKFSNLEKGICKFILFNRESASEVTLTALKKKLALTSKSEQSLMRVWILQFLKYIAAFDSLKEIESWEIPDFPLKGDAFKHKVSKPRNMTPLIEHLKNVWADNGYQIDSLDVDKEADNFLTKMGLNK